MAGCGTQHDRHQPALAARRLATRMSSRLASRFRVLCVLAALPMCIAASATTNASPSAHVNHMPAEASVMPLEHSVVASVCRTVDPSDLWFLESVTPAMTASQVPTVVTMDPVTSVTDTPYPAQTTVCINDSGAVDDSGSVSVDNGSGANRSVIVSSATSVATPVTTSLMSTAHVPDPTQAHLGSPALVPPEPEPYRNTTRVRRNSSTVVESSDPEDVSHRFFSFDRRSVHHRRVSRDVAAVIIGPLGGYTVDFGISKTFSASDPSQVLSDDAAVTNADVWTDSTEWIDEAAGTLPLPPTTEQWEMIHDYHIMRQSLATRQLEHSARVQEEAASRASQAASQEEVTAHRRSLATERLEEAARMQEEAARRISLAALEQEEAARRQKVSMTENQRLETLNRQLNERLQLELQAILAEAKERARQSELAVLEQEEALRRLAVTKETLMKSSESAKALESRADTYIMQAKAYFEENEALNVELRRAVKRLQAEESKKSFNRSLFIDFLLLFAGGVGLSLPICFVISRKPCNASTPRNARMNYTDLFKQIYGAIKTRWNSTIDPESDARQSSLAQPVAGAHSVTGCALDGEASPASSSRSSRKKQKRQAQDKVKPSGSSQAPTQNSSQGGPSAPAAASSTSTATRSPENVQRINVKVPAYILDAMRKAKANGSTEASNGSTQAATQQPAQGGSAPAVASSLTNAATQQPENTQRMNVKVPAYIHEALKNAKR